MTTQQQIREWLDIGKTQGATHLIVAVDRFDNEDYAVYVTPGVDARELVEQKYSGQNMQETMEVYRLDQDWEAQLKEFRSEHY